ncbi:MAG: GlsB/YeaQ/YmgE family stress response membrane protein [Chloroflexi bacterium]|nr:GlsB/YeaQ/YmgE family stress response membrane protein [Chloroflexota bacterium]
MLGAVLGGFVGSALFGWEISVFSAATDLMALLGAAMVVFVVRAVPDPPPFE